MNKELTPPDGFTYVDENYQTPGGPIGWHSPTTKNPDDGSIELQSFGQVSVDSITDVVSLTQKAAPNISKLEIDTNAGLLLRFETIRPDAQRKP